MSRSRKKNPFFALNSPYRIRIGKKFSRRRFRNKSNSMLRTGHLELMPQKMYEVSEIWSITDGKLYCPPSLINENTKSALRKQLSKSQQISKSRDRIIINSPNRITAQWAGNKQNYYIIILNLIEFLKIICLNFPCASTVNVSGESFDTAS